MRPYRPYPFLIGATAFALVPVWFLLGAMTAPVPPGCFEYCELGQDFATGGLYLVLSLWLMIVLAVAWSWREHELTVVAVSAIGASVALSILALFLYDVIVFEPKTQELLVFAWVLSLGLQLPPVWRLAWRQRPSMPLRLVVGGMNLAVALAAVAPILFGNNAAWSPGPSVVFLAWVVFVVGLLIVAVRAWRDGVAPLSLVGPLAIASLLILLIPVGVAAPGEIAYLIFLQIPLAALAWLWIAIGWLRGRDDLANDRRVAAVVSEPAEAFAP
jgi:hypothetical protein